jgi:hypothetical protein
MRPMLKISLLLLLTVVFCPACRSSSDPIATSTPDHLSRRELLRDGTVVIQIGSCAGTEEATEHVVSILLPKGIRPVVHGSRAYAICVPEDRAEQARKLLRSDPQRELFRVLVYDD